MKDEKILKDEVLSENELDEVAGGYADEIQEDANRIRALGRRYGIELLPRNRRVSTREVNDAFVTMGNLITQYLGGKFRLGCDLQEDSKNRYYLNHEKMSRDEIWDRIYDKLDGRY